MFAASTLPQPPWDYAILLLVGLTSAVSCLILLAEPLLNLRDKLVEWGLFTGTGWVGRQTQRRREFKRNKLKGLLEEIGFTEQSRTIVRGAVSRAHAAEQLKSIDCPKLIAELLVAMRRCMVVESNAQQFRPTTGKYYVDMMGAVSVLGPAEWNFSNILGNWLHLLIKEGKLQSFDAILTPKNGNPILTHRAAVYYLAGNSPTVFTWKSFDDRSRVARGGLDTPHFLDFEGLWAFQKARQSNRKLRVIAVDDNFTTGETLASAIQQFNELVKTEEYNQFEAIDTAVALFAIICDDHERHFKRISNDFKVHTLLSFDIAGLAKLASNTKIPELMEQVDTLQSGFSCKVSSNLMEGA